MEIGRFYFITNEFFDKYDPNHTLSQNKKAINGHEANRACFMAFPDEEEESIFWCIPISSKTSKYKQIVLQKAQNRIAKKLPPAECDTIRFSKVLGLERAFLIQNMFPIIKKYILNQYFDNNNQEVRISENSEKDIIYRAQKVLNLHRHGINIIFGDIDTIYRGLKEELAQDCKEPLAT